MKKNLQVLMISWLIIGCSSKPQAPIVINIAPSFPPQYFPNNNADNRNIGNSYEENNNIQEISLEEERGNEVDYGE